MRSPSVRGAYDAVERTAGRHLEAVIRADRFARVTALVLGGQRSARQGLAGASAKVWHLANLPAGTDVQRLRTELGELDREVRRLRLQLSARDGETAATVPPPAPTSEDGDGRR